MKPFLPLVLCGTLLLSGCASMLERSYTGQTVHDRAPALEEDSSILRAEDYQDLVSAVYYVVSQGMTSGTIRLYHYDGDAESDLDAACLEVVQEDPLGAYAVDYIKYNCAHIVSYYEATVAVTYRRTQAQVDAIVTATGSSAIRSELRDALTEYRPEVVLRISHFSEDTDIGLLLHEAYFDAPELAVGIPQAEIQVYPDSGSQRIVEVLLTYPVEREVGLRRAEELTARVEELADRYGVTDGKAPLRAVQTIVDNCAVYDPEGGPTAYDALVGGGADSEGMALAIKLLCAAAGQDADVVEGTLNGEPRCWNRLYPDEGAVFWDAAGATGLQSEEAFAALGYVWPGPDTENTEKLE